MNKKARKYFFSFLSGFTVIVVLVLVMLLISLDLRLLFSLGVILFVSVGWNLSKWSSNKDLYIHLFLINISQALFCYFALSEIPALNFMIIVFLLSVVIGYYSKHALNNKSRVKFYSQLSVISFMLLGGILMIPQLVESELVDILNQNAPEFSFQTLEGEVITSSELNGNVVIIDFFGTWCLPCIPELKDLEEIKKVYEPKGVKFYVLSTGQGGDTPEKVRKYIQKRGFTFQFGFDEGAQVHQLFGFSGVPALVIIDGAGNTRIKHEGYNASEDFIGGISSHLDEILNE